MRTFFEEGDLLVAEVQAFFADGAMSLHTRSLRYGKVSIGLNIVSTQGVLNIVQLRNGQLVIVPPVLIKRLKSHFIALPCGVDLILSLNGYVWVSKHVKASEQEGEDGFDAEAVYSNKNDVRAFHSIQSSLLMWNFPQNIDDATRAAVSRVSNIIKVLAAHFLPLTDTVVLEAYAWVVEQDVTVKDLLQDDIGVALVATISAQS